MEIHVVCGGLDNKVLVLIRLTQTSLYLCVLVLYVSFDHVRYIMCMYTFWVVSCNTARVNDTMYAYESAYRVSVAVSVTLFSHCVPRYSYMYQSIDAVCLHVVDDVYQCYAYKHVYCRTRKYRYGIYRLVALE